MLNKSNFQIWNEKYNPPSSQGTYNARYQCQEFNGPCPECGGRDRVSIFDNFGDIVARCWGKEHGRKGCGKVWTRDQFLNDKDRIFSKQIEKPSVNHAQNSETLKYLSVCHENIFKEEFQEVLSYAKSRKFDHDSIAKFG